MGQNRRVAGTLGVLAPGVAAAYGQLAGISNLRGNTTAHGSSFRQARAEQARTIIRSHLLGLLTEDEREILDLAASNDNAETCGAAVGLTRKQFTRAADAALDRVREILAA